MLIGMRSFTTRYLLTVAAIGVAGGLLLIPVNNYAATIAKGVPLLYAPVVGFWLLPVIVSMVLLRRPAAGVLAALFAGLVNVPTTPYGAQAVVTMVMIGVLVELPFAVTLYKRWGYWLFAGTVLVISALYGGVTWRSLDLASLATWAQVTFFALLIGSGQLAVFLGHLVARRVEKTGVTRGVSRPQAVSSRTEREVESTLTP